ncbi:hypothetical protein N4S61_03810, partial [Burkholderia pseudomallei]|uniref:hypothetical protein n=1 Tax=Burkholderia pseudomallei TaxID=28450 RepID=UPI0029DDB1C5|nr:hypothetical protein [Burkholderia pseudomallei]
RVEQALAQVPGVTGAVADLAAGTATVAAASAIDTARLVAALDAAGCRSTRPAIARRSRRRPPRPETRMRATAARETRMTMPPPRRTRRRSR